MNIFTLWLLGTDSGRQTIMAAQCPSDVDIRRYVRQFNPSNDDYEFMQLISCSWWREDGSPADIDWYYETATTNYQTLQDKLNATSDTIQKRRIAINFFESLASLYKTANPQTYDDVLEATSTMRAYFKIPPNYQDSGMKRQFKDEIKSDQKRFVRSAKKARTSLVQFSKKNVIAVSLTTILFAITVGILGRNK